MHGWSASQLHAQEASLRSHAELTDGPLGISAPQPVRYRLKQAASRTLRIMGNGQAGAASALEPTGRLSDERLINDHRRVKDSLKRAVRGIIVLGPVPQRDGRFIQHHSRLQRQKEPN
eukprot:5590911-Amphidinium_carterae.2